MAEDDWLTVSEVAQQIKTSPATVRRWLRSQRLRGQRSTGGRSSWRVSTAELQRFVASGPALGREPRAPQGGTMTGYERSREG